MLRALIERAKRIGRVQMNPYDRLRGEFKRGEKENVEYLTDDEMEAIRRLPYRPRTELGKARDLFVFQAYTGMSYSDALAFNINNYKLVSGRWIAVGQRIKTGTAYICELLPPVVEVLEAYGWKVPRMSNQVYNRVLKIVGEDACISTPLHSHLARHTFATMMLSHGVKIQNVAKMLGHTNITQTQRYAKVIAQSVREDYEMISNILTQKTKQHEKTTIHALAGVGDADGLQQT
jgi:integrase